MEMNSGFKPILMRNFDKSNLECRGLEKIIDLTAEEIIESVDKIQLIESGIYAESIGDMWRKFNGQKEFTKYRQLIAGLNNNDSSYVSICLIEKDPISVFEGMAIAGKATNISKGIIYIPKEKALLKEKLEEQLEKINLDSFRIEIAVGKIDIRELNENMLIHHIETLAAISAYFNLGNDFRQTKIIAVTGAVKTPIINEVDASISIKNIIEEIGGGFSCDVKTIVVGGKTGKCISQSEAEKESFQGYGMNEIIVLSSKDCIVDFAKQGISEVYKSTCGKCTFCREGAYQLRQMLTDATEGKGKADDLALMEEIAAEMSEETLCSLGQSAAAFVQSSLVTLKLDYETHIKRKNCPSGICKAFLNIAIMGDKCEGCGQCMDACDYDAIEGKNGYIHMIDEFECTKCGKCIDACPNSAIVKVPANKTVGPDKLTRVGRWKKK